MWGFGGSGDMFADGRGTQYSFNHVTAPYGFTLTDLVSYSELEGKVSEHSWNCGHEGPTSDPAVIETRIKQVTPSSIYHVSTWSLFLILALPL
jgi:isoamylase